MPGRTFQKINTNREMEIIQELFKRSLNSTSITCRRSLLAVRRTPQILRNAYLIEGLKMCKREVDIMGYFRILRGVSP